MSCRLFEEKSHAKVYAEVRPYPPVDLIRHIIEFVQQKIDGPLTNAVDLGCGSGQCTFMLGNFFQRVVGTDISEAQIQEANKECVKRNVKNIEFKISPGEIIPVADKSIQLITICTAAHFMDLNKIYEEGRRVLIPGGVLAIFSYGWPVVECNVFPGKNTEFQTMLQETRERFFKYAVPAALKLNQYRNIIIPYNDLTRGFDFVREREISLTQICGIIQSYSFYQLLVHAEGQSVAENLLSSFMEKVMKLFASGGGGEFTDEMKIFTEKTFYFLVMARL